jgi:hypothetical protein
MTTAKGTQHGEVWRRMDRLRRSRERKSRAMVQRADTPAAVWEAARKSRVYLSDAIVARLKELSAEYGGAAAPRKTA